MLLWKVSRRQESGDLAEPFLTTTFVHTYFSWVTGRRVHYGFLLCFPSTLTIFEVTFSLQCRRLLGPI
jgi:hypothetical protein